MATTEPAAIEPEAARAAILASPDVEYAIIVAIELALSGRKGDAPVAAAGRDLLAALPRQAVRRQLEAIDPPPDADGERREIEGLLNSLAPH